MHEPRPALYNPPVTRWGHVWRTLLALLVSMVVWLAAAPWQWQHHRALFWLDVTLGIAGFVLSFFRRRWPFAVALVLTLASPFSATSSGPGVLAAVSLATRRRTAQIVTIGALNIATLPLFDVVQHHPPSQGNTLVAFGFGTAFTVGLLLFGMYVGSRRELVWTLRDRAERAEAEQELRVAQARSTERERIAREMHDVLAHRISLLTMHAGALAYRDDLEPEEVRRTAALIQTKAHEALTDLRQVLGVLRQPEPGPERREQPQPTFADLHSLIAEAEQSGMRVRYRDRVVDAVAMPDQVGRTTYRIVQEGLTNARKHAPGTTVALEVAGSPADGLSITVRNPARSLLRSSTPGAGLGLVGLTERATLAGGRLESRTDAGDFTLHGWLPWRAHEPLDAVEPVRR